MAGSFPRKRGILVGVDKYERVKPLAFCGADAKAIGEAFRKSLQFDDKDILEFTIESGYKPELSEIIHHVGEFLAGKMGKISVDELLVFYFSGHGMIKPEDGKDYLLPIDASPYDLGSSSIPVQYFVDHLTQTKCKNIVMFIDACRELAETGVSQSFVGRCAAPASLAQRTETIEIGRWIVHPAYRASGRPALQLAAASAALAITLGNGSLVKRGIVLCSAGTGDRQGLDACSYRTCSGSSNETHKMR